WSLTIEGLVTASVRWSWDELTALPVRDWVVDISCVTKWTHLDMRWRGVSVDTLLEAVELQPSAAFVIAYSDGGYTTNLPLADARSDTPGAARRLAACDRRRGPRRDGDGPLLHVGARGLDRPPARPACRPPGDRRGRLQRRTVLLDRVGARTCSRDRHHRR